MFSSILGSVTKAALGVVTLPLAVASDLVTMGGAMTDRDEPYTATQISDIVKNVEDAVKPTNGRN